MEKLLIVKATELLTRLKYLLDPHNNSVDEEFDVTDSTINELNAVFNFIFEFVESTPEILTFDSKEKLSAMKNDIKDLFVIRNEKGVEYCGNCSTRKWFPVPKSNEG